MSMSGNNSCISEFGTPDCEDNADYREHGIISRDTGSGKKARFLQKTTESDAVD